MIFIYDYTNNVLSIDLWMATYYSLRSSQILNYKLDSVELYLFISAENVSRLSFSSRK